MEIVIRMCIYGSLLAAAVICFRHFAYHQFPKRFFVVLWLVVSARLLLPFFIPVRLESVPFYGHDILTGENGDKILYEVRQIADNSSLAGVSSGIRESSAALSLTAVLFVVWLIVAVFLIGGMLYRHLISLRKYGDSLPVTTKEVTEWRRSHSSFRDVQIRTSEEVGCPLTYGLLRPVILLPAGLALSRQELAYILEHEWIHIKRCDILVKYLMYLTAAIYWFNPLVWVMVSKADRDIEAACDEAVLRRYHTDHRENYAHLLVHMARRRSLAWSVKADFCGFSELEERIKSIMKMKKYTWKTAALAVVVLSCTTPVFTSAAAPDKVQEQAAAEYSGVSAPTDTIGAKAVTGEQIAVLARKQEGASYVYGGADLSEGVDSGGFLKAVYALEGIELPERIEEQAACGTGVSEDGIAPGDLVFYSRINEDGSISLIHAAIYVGEGTVIHASNAKEGVKYSALNYRDIGKIVRVIK